MLKISSHEDGIYPFISQFSGFINMNKFLFLDIWYFYCLNGNCKITVGGICSMMECLPSRCEAMGLMPNNPHPPKKPHKFLIITNIKKKQISHIISNSSTMLGLFTDPDNCCRFFWIFGSYHLEMMTVLFLPVQFSYFKFLFGFIMLCQTQP